MVILGGPEYCTFVLLLQAKINLQCAGEKAASFSDSVLPVVSLSTHFPLAPAASLSLGLSLVPLVSFKRTRYVKVLSQYGLLEYASSTRWSFAGCDKHRCLLCRLSRWISTFEALI